MEAKVIWNGDMSFTGTGDTGFAIPLDAHKKVGGHNAGFRPLELMAIGLVGCTAMDVISILKKKRQEVTDFTVSASVKRADDHPKVFTEILIQYKVTGKNLDQKAVERAVDLSESTYCGAQAMLRETAEISHEIIILEAD
jgi:putative redox protein